MNEWLVLQWIVISFKLIDAKWKNESMNSSGSCCVHFIQFHSGKMNENEWMNGTRSCCVHFIQFHSCKMNENEWMNKLHS